MNRYVLICALFAVLTAKGAVLYADTDRHEDHTGSISTLAECGLKGNAAGLQVIPGDGRPGSAPEIRIRGSSSLKSPLIVIDGVPVNGLSSGGISHPLELINVHDIERIYILKDAAATAIYGPKAANGAILIIMKKGSGARPHVTYDGNFRVLQNSAAVPVMSASELVDFYGKLYPAGTVTGNAVAGLSKDSDTDWQSLIFRTAFATEHNVGVYGNYRSHMPYKVSLTYSGQQGTLRGSDYNKATAYVDINPDFLDKHLTLDINIKGGYTHSHNTPDDVIGTAAFYNPTQDPYWRTPDGAIDFSTTNGYWNYGSGRGGEFLPNSNASPSPLSSLYDNISKASELRFVGSVSLGYRVHGFEALKLNMNASLDIIRTDSYDGVRPGSFQAYGDTSNLGVGSHTLGYDLTRSQIFETYADYNEAWGSHSLDILAGYSWENDFVASRSVDYFNQTDEIKLNPGETPQSRYLWYKNENYLISFYGRINYSLDSRYIFTFTARGDGSSRFAGENRWCFLPSGAFAWNIAKEKFMAEVKEVSELKLRTSVGLAGQQGGIGDYLSLARYVRSNNPSYIYNMGTAYCNRLTPQAYNPSIEWETTLTYNVGLDFKFFGDRLSGSLDAYLADTKNLLNTIQVPMGSDYGNLLVANIGTVRNRGLEFSVNGLPVKTEDWSLNLGFSGTFQDSRFTRLNASDDLQYYVGTGNISQGSGDYLCRQMVDYAPYTYCVYQQKYDDYGKPIQNEFVDRTGDGKITEADRYMTGKSAVPKFYYGLNAKLSYKNWDLGLNGHGSADTWVFNDFMSANSSASIDVNAGVLPNLAQLVRRTGFTAANSARQWYSDYFIEDASFFRLDEISLGYTLPSVGKSDVQINLSLGIQNVFILTGYSGMDPEVSAADGIDNIIYPRPRVYSLSVGFKF